MSSYRAHFKSIICCQTTYMGDGERSGAVFAGLGFFKMDFNGAGCVGLVSRTSVSFSFQEGQGQVAILTRNANQLCRDIGLLDDNGPFDRGKHRLNDPWNVLGEIGVLTGHPPAQGLLELGAEGEFANFFSFAVAGFVALSLHLGVVEPGEAGLEGLHVCGEGVIRGSGGLF